MMLDDSFDLTLALDLKAATRLLFDNDFDIVLLDPPYASDLGVKVLRLLVTGVWIHSKSTIVLERAYNKSTLECPEPLAIQFQRRYGDTELLLLESTLSE